MGASLGTSPIRRERPRPATEREAAPAAAHLRVLPSRAVQTTAPASQHAGAQTADEPACLAVADLACSRAGRTLFAGLGFGLDPGGVVQVEGPNGSGKTTLLRAVCGLVPVDAGRITWRGEPVAPGAELAYIGHVPGVKDDLTGRENLATARALGGPARGLEPVDALARLDLDWAAGLPARRLSAGQRRCLALARLLVTPAPLWVLDEPLATLDADGKLRLEAMIGEHAGGGGMTLISTHQPLALAGVTVEHLWLEG